MSDNRNEGGQEPVAPIDPEVIFACVAAGSWARAIACVRRAPAGWSRHQPVAARAEELLIAGLEGAVSNGELDADELENVVVLGRARRLSVSRDFESRVIAALLDAVRSDPERALSIARFRPDLPVCASVIAQYGAPGRRTEDFGTVRTGTHELHHGTVQAGRSVFRSPRERAFHEAAVRAFAGDLVVPNAALSAALDYERLRARLSNAERRYFFTALVDCIVFGRSQGYLPTHFFELDSSVHDDYRRAEKDALKDRIVALAGYRLVRIRPEEQADDPAGYGPVLAAAVREIR